jgi:molybdopterin-binding protein
METSARNQLKGTVVSVSLGTVMAEVTVDVKRSDDRRRHHEGVG